MTRLYDNILQTIGNTPVVRINKLAPVGINIFVKIESFNPMGSVKDRLALGVVEDAERRGTLKPGQTIVEASSGNTGIGLAMVCAQKGYPLVIVMAENFSIERRKMMRFLGAQVILTPASDKGSGMLNKAQELADKHGWWLPKQFENPANADVHHRTTAQEILVDFSGLSLDYWVSGFGTGGTLNGVARGLKEASPNTQIMVCEPDNAQIMASGIAQARNSDGSNSASHPRFRPHLMQGWSPDFIPKLAEQAQLAAHIDGYLPVDGAFSLQCAKDLAQQEGIFAGITAGATLAGALKLAETAPRGSNILCMVPDTGERYLSTPLFDGIAIDMNETETALSQSTAGFRFDLNTTTSPTDENSTIDERARLEMQAICDNKEQPIVMFALEWCEFCWSVRKVLKEYNISYLSADLDSVKYLEGNRGGNIRNALKAKTGCNTFPQIFVGGEFIGGCSDLFDGIKDGSMMQKIDALNIARDKNVSTDPYSFLPGWLHAR